MKRMITWCLLLAGCLLLALPMCAQEDDDDGGGGGILDPALQWSLAETSWGRMQYDDAAVLMLNFAKANPDHENALEAYWRAWYVYHAHRPNPERKKKVQDLAMDACARWETKYAEKDKVRLAASFWYRAQILANLGDRTGGERYLKQLLDRAQGTRFDGDAVWSLAEWLNSDGKWNEAIQYYEYYRKVVGQTDVAALSIHRQVEDYLRVKNNEDAIRVGREILGDKYNWYGYYLYTYALEVAKMVKTAGDDKLAREIALRLVEKGPNYENIINPAKTFLGENVSKRILISPYFYDNFSTGNINVDARTRLEHTITMNTLWRMSFITKEEPFEGTLKIAPKQTMLKYPATLKAVDEDGRSVYTADFKVPDANGAVPGDMWFNFENGAADADTPPDGLVITRKFEKMGNTWGICTVRIQTSARWELSIKVLNDKTAADNISPKPYSIYEGGRSFYYPNWIYDPTQGTTFRFPVEVGANVTEYYPEISMSHYINPPYKPLDTNTATPEFDFRYFNVKVVSPKEFPCTFSGPSWVTVLVKEVVK